MKGARAGACVCVDGMQALEEQMRFLEAEQRQLKAEQATILQELWEKGAPQRRLHEHMLKIRAEQGGGPLPDTPEGNRLVELDRQENLKLFGLKEDKIWNGMKIEFNRDEREALRIKIAEERQRQRAHPMPNLAHLR